MLYYRREEQLHHDRKISRLEKSVTLEKTPTQDLRACFHNRPASDWPRIGARTSVYSLNNSEPACNDIHIVAASTTFVLSGYRCVAPKSHDSDGTLRADVERSRQPRGMQRIYRPTTPNAFRDGR